MSGERVLILDWSTVSVPVEPEHGCALAVAPQWQAGCTDSSFSVRRALSGGETPPALWRHLRHVLMVQHVVGTDRCSTQDLVDIVRDPQYRERSRMVEEERPGRPVRRAQNDRASTPP